MDLKEKIKNLPKQPGVYIMSDVSQKPIYIGKAKDLRNRVSSYFNKKMPDPKNQVLVSKIRNIEFIVTANEADALILEDTLIKKHLPRYNILLKDDKRYPSIKITIRSEDYPRLLVVREHDTTEDLYFGPYTSVRPIRKIIQMLNRLFPLRKCKKKLMLKKKEGLFLKPVEKVCLNFQLGLCLGPCQGRIPPDEYAKIVGQVILFLKGENQKLIKTLDQEMKEYSEKLEFEKAKMIRDRISAIQSMMEQQRIVTGNRNSKDILYITEQNNIFNITILFIREGKMIGKDNFIIKNSINDQKGILNDFINRFYLNALFLPEEIILPFNIEDKQIFTLVIRQKKKIRIRVHTAREELDHKLLKMAKENSVIELANYLMDLEYKSIKKQIKTLKQELKIKRQPNIIEGFDISNIQGAYAVGSMVRFTNGVPDKKEYRKFRIRTVDRIDDFKMIAEIVFRRYKRLQQEQMPLPDLVLIDGGRQQLNAAVKSLDNLGLKNIPVISLAKKEEEIYLPERADPLKLSKSNLGLKLLQKVRDEAHRFAVTFHKQIRSKGMLK